MGWILWLVVVIVVVIVVGVLLHVWRVRRIVDTLHAPSSQDNEPHRAGATSFDNALYEDGSALADAARVDGATTCVIILYLLFVCFSFTTIVCSFDASMLPD